MLTAVAMGLVFTTLIGCQTPSLNGLGPEGMTHVPEINGVWVDQDEPGGAADATVSIMPHEDGYHIMRVLGASAQLRVALYRIDDHIVGDLTLHALGGLSGSEDSDADAQLISGFVIPVHHFAVFNIENDKMFMSFIDSDWLSGRIDAGHPGATTTSFGNDSDRTVLTANSANLRTLIRKAIADGFDAFEEPNVFHRVARLEDDHE